MTLTIDHYFFPSIDSTNLWAKANAKHFHPEHLTVVSAGAQTAGRGRENRKWISPANVNIYSSYCLFVPHHRKDLGNVAQVVAMAIADFLQRQEIDARLKWPNDILVDGKKIAGILSETTPIQDNTVLVIGIGLNVNMLKNDLKEISQKATSMAVEANQLLDLDTINSNLEQAIKQQLEQYMRTGFEPFLEPFRDLLIHRLGDAMQFHLGAQLMQGTFHSINRDGTLNLILNDRIQAFNSGEIV